MCPAEAAASPCWTCAGAHGGAGCAPGDAPAPDRAWAGCPEGAGTLARPRPGP